MASFVAAFVAVVASFVVVVVVERLVVPSQGTICSDHWTFLLIAIRTG